MHDGTGDDRDITTTSQVLYPPPLGIVEEVVALAEALQARRGRG